MEKILKSAVFTSLKKQQLYLKDESIASLFKLEDNRVSDFEVFNEISSFNFSNVLVDEKTLGILKKLFVSRKVNEFFDDYFLCEDGFSYHYLYRAAADDKYKLNGKYVWPAIEKFYTGVDEVFDKTQKVFYSDFVVIADEYNCKQLENLFGMVCDYFAVGKKIHFVKNRCELDKVLNSVFVEQTFFFFADRDLKNEVFSELFEYLNSKFEGINNQICFICQNIKFAEVFKASHIINYSSLVNFSFDYFVQFAAISKFVMGAKNRDEFLSGIRISDLDLKDNFVNSFALNFACILSYQVLFSDNLVRFENEKLADYFVSLVNSLREEKTDFDRGICLSESSLFSDKEILKVIFHFKGKNDEEFLKEISYMNKNNFSFLTFINKGNDLKTLGFLCGVLENVSLMLKVLFDDKLSQEKLGKNLDVNNKSVFIKRIMEQFSQ